MKNYFAIPLIAATLTACQTMYVPQAREVKKKPQANGIIAMPTNYRAEDRLKAEELMKQNCGNLAVKVSDEGEVVTGQATKSLSSATGRDDTRRNAGSLFGIPVVAGAAGGMDTENNAVTTQLKEWQVVYDCASEKPTTKAKR